MMRIVRDRHTCDVVQVVQVPVEERPDSSYYFMPDMDELNGIIYVNE